MSCPDCFKGSIHEHGVAQGKEETIYGMRTYVAGPPKSTTPKSSILFLTDAFGLELINNKILADRYAEETGFRVLMPDCITGGAMPVSTMAFGESLKKPTAWYNIFGQLQRLWALARMVSRFIPFMIKGHPTKAYPALVKYARAMRADLPPGGKLGVCGFCWGGWPSTKLCTEPAVEGGSQGLIDAQFNAHPSFLSIPTMIIDAIKTFKVPYSSAVAATDFMLNEKKALETEAKLRQEVGTPEEANYELVIYKDCGHGFAVRADPFNNKIEGQGAEDAANQAVNWFKRFLS